MCPPVPGALHTAVLPLHAGKKTDGEKEKEKKEEGGVITVALVGSSQDVLWNAGSGGQNWIGACPQPDPRRPVLILAVTFEARRLKVK